MVNATEKRCPKCSKVLPAADFYADRHARDGLSSRCRLCFCAEQRRYAAEAAADPVRHERQLASHRRYSKTDKGKAAQRRGQQKWAERQREARARSANRAYVERCGPHVI